MAELPVLTAGSPFPAGLSQVRNTGKDLPGDDGWFSEQSKSCPKWMLCHGNTPVSTSASQQLRV